jgi:predicted alpha/beta superfamily hydrolase
MFARLHVQLVVIGNIAMAACHGPTPSRGVDASTDAQLPDGSGRCAPGLAGAPCVLALYDRAVASCDSSVLASLTAELDDRAKLGPLWAGGRALFRTAAPLRVAGDWNGWSANAPATAPLCGGSLLLAVAPVPTGRHVYKLTDGTTWSLDPTNPAFAYDDFAGNPDHRNSVLDTPDSGLGHLVELDQACSTALGNCRAVTAYLPAGYDAPESAARTYPVLFMHDGQNVWDDHTCCFGHTGWELDVTLDAEIAAGKVMPIVVIGADSTSNRNNEYGLDPATTAAFISFQVGELQPHALAQVRADPSRIAIGGSSLGGLVAMELALREPGYIAVAALSGAFWPGADTHSALVDELPGLGKHALVIYLDSGGALADNSDGAADTAAVRDALVGLGWLRTDSPACRPGPDTLCYHLEPGATHDELAWKARAWRFLEALFPP